MFGLTIRCRRLDFLPRLVINITQISFVNLLLLTKFKPKKAFLRGIIEIERALIVKKEAFVQGD